MLDECREKHGLERLIRLGSLDSLPVTSNRETMICSISSNHQTSRDAITAGWTYCMSLT